MPERQYHPKRHSDASQTSHASPVNPVVQSGTSSGGQALARHTQAAMSARFGHDFSSVRVHTDAQAGESAQALGANAYAHGADIVFAAGQWVPGSLETERLLAHELTHVVQQDRHGLGDPARASSRDDASEREADDVAEQVRAGQSVRVQAAPQAALARDEDGSSSWLSSAWNDTKAAAGAVYNSYEKATDLRPGEKALSSGINWVENKSAAGNQKMVDEAQGHWYAPLAQGLAAVENGTTQILGGGIEGAVDLGAGLTNTFTHPLDTAAGMEGILEHNTTVPFLSSTLKAGHGLYDLAANGGGEYGHSLGDLAGHIFNPMTQMQDDMAYDKKLATGILAPDGWDVWKDKPLEAATRALVNVAPAVMGMGEAAGEGGVEASRVASPVPEVPSPVSPLATTGEFPRPVSPVSPLATTGEFPQPVGPVAPPEVNPFGKTEVNPFGKTEVPVPADAPADVARTRNPVQQLSAIDPAQMSPGAPQPPGFRSGPVMPSAPEFGTPEWGEQLPAPDSVPDTERGMPPISAPGRAPTLPGVGEPGPALPAQENVPEAPSAPRPSRALTGDAPPEPADDPGDIHKRKTGDRASSLPPASVPDLNNPFFDPTPAPPTPSVEELLEGLKTPPAAPVSDPLGPLLD